MKESTMNEQKNCNIPFNRVNVLKKNITDFILQIDNHKLGVHITIIQDINIKLVYYHNLKL